MAQIDDIFEQIDEQVDADKAHKFWLANRKWIIGGLVLLFAGLIAFVSWRDARIKADQKLSDLYIQAGFLDEQGDRVAAAEIYDQLMEKHADHGYGLLSMLVDAQALAKAGDVEAALVRFEKLAAKAAYTPLQGLALLNAAYLTADDAQRSRGFLAKISAQSPFRPHALELDGLLLAQAGDEINSLARYREAIQLGADGELRRRLDRRMERMAGKN